MFWHPLSEEILSCKLQMRKANANGSFEQQAISCLSRVNHANNKRKQNNKKVTNDSKQSNIKQKVNLDLNKARKT